MESGTRLVFDWSTQGLVCFPDLINKILAVSRDNESDVWSNSHLFFMMQQLPLISFIARTTSQQ